MTIFSPVATAVKEAGIWIDSDFFGLRAIFVANETSLFNNIRVNTKGCTLLCGSSAHSDKIEQDVLNGQNRSGKTNSNFNVSQDPFRREQNDQLTQTY